MFWRLTIYLKFTPKMNDICVKSIILFALEIILNVVIFCIKVIFGERELLVPVDLWKSSFEKICKRVTFWGRQKESTCASTFLSFTFQYMFGRNFTQFENSTEKMRYFVSAVWPVLVLQIFHASLNSYVNTRPTL